QGKYTHNDYHDVNAPLPFGSPNAVQRPILLQEQLDASVNVSMPLIAPPAYPALEAVKANVRASEANFEVSEDQLLFSVAQTFYAAGIADEVLVARRSSVDVARVTLDNARTRHEAG